MKFGKILILMSIISVVFLAGCAKQTSVATAGVVIEKFASQVSNVPSNSPVELTLIVKNTGESEAKDVKAILGGLSFLTSSISEETGKYWRSENREVFKDFLKRLDSGNLLGEDLISGFKGGQDIVTWHLTTPIQTRDQTYEPTVNLVYDYSTISTILIKAVNFGYFQSLPEDKQKLVDTGVIVSKTTKGPIEVSVKSDQAVISDFSTLPIEIEFKNVGGGRTFLGGSQESDSTTLYTNIKAVDRGKGLDKIFVELPPDMSCNLNPFGENTQNRNKIYEVRLIQGKNGKILCNKVIGGVSTTQTLSMDIKAEYRYLIEGKTAVKVSRTLYQPPIYDISLDVIPGFEHTHNEKTTATLEAKVTNVGNQIVDITRIDGTVSINKGYDEHALAYKNTKLGQFDHESVFVASALPRDVKQITIESEVGKIKFPDPADPNKEKDEENTANNKFTSTIPIDYDIAVQNLKAKVRDINIFSVEINTIVINNGKNVIGKNVPYKIIVNDGIDDINVCGNFLAELKPLTNQEITCTYNNPGKKLEFEIKASVPPSELETDFGLTPDKQNNVIEDKFKINYDLRLTDIKSELAPDGFNKETGEVTYKLSAKVKNVGNVVANIVTVATTTDSTVEFKSGVREPLCQKLEGSVKDLEPTKVSGEIVCITHPIKADEFEAVARIIGAPSVPGRTVDEKTFTVISPAKIVHRFDIVSNRGELSPHPNTKKDISNGQFHYTLTTEVKNSGTVVVKDLVVTFKDSSGNILCDTAKSPIGLQPEESSVPNCPTGFLPSEKFEATAVVTAKDMVKQEQSFIVDSKINRLISSDVTGVNSWPIDSLVANYDQDLNAEFTAAGQTFKPTRNFRLTKISVSLTGTDPGSRPFMKIIADGELRSVLVPIPDGSGYFANFDGNTLQANTVYTIELICKYPCEGKRYLWKHGDKNTYSDGNGFLYRRIDAPCASDPSRMCVKSLEKDFLPNNGDFGFQVYGIEK